MDFIWILFAFVCGLSLRLIALPPLIGYLIAGFALNYMGYTADVSLQTLADMGITLMLFTIGLKLNIKDLLKTEIWLTTFFNMGVWIILMGGVFFCLSVLAIGLFAAIDLQTIALIVFALSFSSTVCIVKILEENGELKTRHGQVAIGVLVMQDIVAVGFLVAATGSMPSPWSPLLFGLIFLRPLIGKVLEKSGHGELLPLTGFFLALGCYELFYWFNIKGDLGALLAGVLVSGHFKSTELYKSLMSFKDLFLIGFFLSIGFTALPDFNMILIALGLVVLLPIKYGLFFLAFVKTHLRSRTAFISSLALSNYSEFGLIVIALCVSSGWLGKEWLVILALAVSFSFVLTSVIYPRIHGLYSNWNESLKSFESKSWIKSDIVFQPIGAEILVIGMGRVGRGAYQALREMIDDKVWGMDADSDRIKLLNEQGLQVFVGDGEDADLWENFNTESINLILLALPSVEDMQHITEQLREVQFKGKIAAIARFEDEAKILSEAGIDKIFNFYTEAGVGFAEESLALVNA